MNTDNTINTDADNTADTTADVDNTADNTADTTADVDNTADNTVDNTADNTVDNTADNTDATADATADNTDATADATAANTDDNTTAAANTTADGTTDDNTTADGTTDDNTTAAANTTADGTTDDNTTADGTTDDNTTADATTDDNTAADNTADTTAANTTVDATTDDNTAADTTADTTAATTDTATSDTNITSAITDTDNSATGDTPTDDTAPDNGDSTSDAGDSTSDDTPSKPSASEWIMAHKWIIAVIVIVSIIIICIALFFGYKYYKKYQESQAQKQNPNKALNLELCKYGLNATKTACKNKDCVAGQINSIYGECKELTTFCKKGVTYYGINAAGNNCNMNCNYTGTLYGKYNPVWKSKYPKSITAYKSIWENTNNGGCSIQQECKDKGGIPPPGQATTDPIASCGYICKKLCITAVSAHTSKGNCTENGCTFGHNAAQTGCNKSCPAMDHRDGYSDITSFPINSKVFSYKEAGTCTIKCTTENVIKDGSPIYLPGPNGTSKKFACKLKCPYPNISESVLNEDKTALKCIPKCVYGATHSRNNCNDNCETAIIHTIGGITDYECDYPNCQNTKNGICKRTLSNTLCNNGWTHQGLRKSPQYWGYKANRSVSIDNNDNPTKHGCFPHTIKNTVSRLYTTANGVSGVFHTKTCTYGVSTTMGNIKSPKVYGTKCNKGCINNIRLDKKPGEAGALSKNVSKNKTHAYCLYDVNTCTQNFCTTNCTAHKGLTDGGSACIKNCHLTDIKIANTVAGVSRYTYNGHNPVSDITNLYCNGITKKKTPEGVLIGVNSYALCESNQLGTCKLITKCSKYGVNRNRTGCNSNGRGYCGNEGKTETKLGGTTYQKYYHNETGVCKLCTNGVNYNKTGCNKPPIYTSDKWMVCVSYADTGACQLSTFANALTAGDLCNDTNKVGGAMFTHSGQQWNFGECNNGWLIPAKNYHWAWNGSGKGSCYSIGPAARSNAGQVAAMNGYCINCGFGGATRLRSAHDPAGYQKGISKRICFNNVCPNHNTRTIANCDTKFPS